MTHKNLPDPIFHLKVRRQVQEHLSAWTQNVLLLSGRIITWILAFGIEMRWESKFLSTESKNGIHEQANTHGSKQTGFIIEEESTKLSA